MLDMELLPMEKLGTREFSGNVVQFGVFLPWVSKDQGNRMWVKIIHEKDQFLQDTPPKLFEMQHSTDPVYGDYWSTKVKIDSKDKPHPKSAWGKPGRYVYRYYLENPEKGKIIDWISDPFAREFGIGKLSAFTLGYKPYEWSINEKNWKTPPLENIIMYELMINEFGGSIDETIDKLDYLQDLGINCISVMPVSNVSNVIDWGYLPIGYFGVDDRFGKRKDFQKFVDEAHKRGISVILDAIYGHTSDQFTYSYLYRELGYVENPFLGDFAKNYFGEGTDFNKKFTRDFFFTVNYKWLENYHVDGFRYDCVPNYYEGPMDRGYANLTYCTYQMIKDKGNSNDDSWQRFFNNGEINLIQCAEQLEGPEDILMNTYSNCTWQNRTIEAARDAAKNPEVWKLEMLGKYMGLLGFPSEIIHNDMDKIKKTALQYIENHDHSRFICNFDSIASGQDSDLFKEGKRNEKWFKVQPYLIAILTAKGIPMLWQGQEFCENYFVPWSGMGRVALSRPVRWDYFYDSVGKSIIWLVRRLIKLRKNLPQLKSGDHYFYNDCDKYLSKNVIVFSRSKGNDKFSLIALNFSDSDQYIPFDTFPFNGDYTEELHGEDNLSNIVPGNEYWLKIPSNYGRIWSFKTGV